MGMKPWRFFSDLETCLTEAISEFSKKSEVGIFLSAKYVIPRKFKGWLLPM